jgi:acetyl esterase/lipase
MEGIDAIRELFEASPLPRIAGGDVLPLRRRLDALGARLAPPAGVVIEDVTMGPVAGLRALPPGGAKGRSILFLHGGCYVAGSPRASAGLAGRLALDTDAEVIVPAYRLAPEHPYPAAIEDATAAWGWMLTTRREAARAAFCGEGSGGGLALGTALAARRVGLPVPRACVLFSPWSDLGQSAQTFRAKADDDPVLSRSLLDACAAAYLGARAARETGLASPLHADLAGLPETLIHVGSEEVLLGDADTLLKALRSHGVTAVLEIWANMLHGWHQFHGQLDEGAEAVRDVGKWLARRLDEAQAPKAA